MRIDPADVVTGALDAAGRAEAERLMREDPAFRAEVEGLRAVAARLDALPPEAWDPPEPPPLRIADLGTVGAARPARRRRWRLSVPVPVLAVASVALLAAGVALGSLMGDDGPAAPRTERALALAALPEAPRAHGQAEVLTGGELAIRMDGLPASRDGDFYAVWLLDASGEMIPIGSFRVGADGTATVRVPLPEDPSRFDYVDVSVEPGDGDPRHSGHSVLRGTTA